ncbi:MAG: hypothetical protein WCF22_11620 [Candidatus Sulfotelmatobacter sp.]
MNAMAGTNPEGAAVTEVICVNAEQAAQAGPVGISNGDIDCEVKVAGLVEGLV